MTEHELARQLVERGIVDEPTGADAPPGGCRDESGMLWIEPAFGLVLSLSDPATVGVLLGMLLERVEVAVVKSCNGYHEVVFARVDGGEEVWFCGDVRGEAIARALLEVSQ